MENKSAFKVIADGREYEVFADGTVSGFGENAIVLNRIPHLLREAFQAGKFAAAEVQTKGA